MIGYVPYADFQKASLQSFNGKTGGSPDMAETAVCFDKVSVKKGR